MLTDRNDLDDQLFNDEFAPSHSLPEKPRHADRGRQLRELLAVNSGGIIFTTIQKFGTDAVGAGPLSDRRNVVVFVDEAHRTQYGLIDGFAARMRTALPNATFIGFTGTPLALADRSTTEVFGDYISTYTPQQSIEDGATVPVYYESRLIKVGQKADQDAIDETFEALTEDLPEDEQERIGARFARMERLLSIGRGAVLTGCVGDRARSLVLVVLA